MYVEDVKEEFYELLTGKRLTIIANYDIDGVCTCKILQALLRYTQTIYTLEVVTGLEEVRHAYSENAVDCKYFLFVNCCGTIDLVEFLDPDEDRVFFVLDAHRPTDLCNIFSNGQVRLLASPEDDVSVPDFHDVFREEEEEEEQESEEEEEDGDNAEEDEVEQVAKRRRTAAETIEARILRRRERARWEENRNRLLFEYSQFTYYHKASAIFMYNLAWKLNQDDKDLLWWTIVALSEQLLLAKIEGTTYVLETGQLQAHATRLQNRSKDGDEKTALRINIERDLRLILYRHWTVEASLRCSPATCCRLALWTQRGTERVQQLLAEIALPLVQSRQKYKDMDLALRAEFVDKMQRVADKYGLSDLAFTTFALQYGYGHKFVAADFVYALHALLEGVDARTTPKERFLTALLALARNKNELLYESIERAKHVAQSVYKNVHSALEKKRVMTAGPFFYYVLQEGTADWQMFHQPHALQMFAHFLLRAFATISKNKKVQAMPLIVAAPFEAGGDCLMIGVPPLCENSPKNFFGKAFEQAADRAGAEDYCDYFDTSFFRLPVKDRSSFIDALTGLLS